MKHRNQHCEESLIETKLHDQVNTQVYVYTKIEWTLDIRKEVLLFTSILNNMIVTFCFPQRYFHQLKKLKRQ
jgi:hypothetical protein